MDGICTDIMLQRVMIGKTNPSSKKVNNNILLAPALVVSETDIDAIIQSMYVVLTRLTL